LAVVNECIVGDGQVGRWPKRTTVTASWRLAVPDPCTGLSRNRCVPPGRLRRRCWNGWSRPHGTPTRCARSTRRCHGSRREVSPSDRR
jgi:hypothetical protein